MKILVISDVHANAECLKAIFARESDADAIYMAGDCVDYGTQPTEAIDLLRSHNVLAVRGNHDDRVLNFYREGNYNEIPAEGDIWAKYNCRLLSAKYVQYLETLPQTRSFVADGIGYLITHRYADGYKIIESQYHFDAFWQANYTGEKNITERRMIFGHTHRQMILQFENGLWLNPGSASYRREDEPSKEAFYAVIENGKISLRHLPYNREPLYKACEQVKDFMQPNEWRVAKFFFGE